MSGSPTPPTAPDPARALVVRAGTGPRHDLRHGRGSSEQLVGPATGAEQVLVFRVTIPPGSQPGPYHLHRHAENIYIALEGSGDVIAADRTHRLEPGDAIVIPAGVPHAHHNPTSETCVMLAIYDRPIADDFEVVERAPGEHG